MLPVRAAGLVCCSTCQLPAWCCAGGASCRLGVVLPVPAAGLVNWCWCQLPAWWRCCRCRC
ncbi:hypothetical protein PR001_g33376 [Phytophthora rubi]|uniref:Uncharacterized protein n=1 Tax=Phytophthora rubi TaxID=129364 RepID=A0A6A3G6A2_9STRA|nr:hypothetical protein PR001_g33376 [Phytophthora rubi]KAE8952256.1 hypothetical protein PR002_g32729 [Phytophthora rubi]